MFDSTHFILHNTISNSQVRGLGLPHLLFPSLLVTFRTAVSDPFKIHNRNANGGNNANVGNNGAAMGMDELYGCYSREMFRLPDQVCDNCLFFILLLCFVFLFVHFY